MKKTSLRKIPWSSLAIDFILFFSLAVIFLNYFGFDFEKNFGYLDYQLYWQNLSDLAVGKVIYRDFFWEYGFLYLLLGLPFFLLLGKTFLANFFARLIVLPTLAIFLSFLLGREFLKKWFLFLFLTLLLFFGVNNDFTSLRHLLPELGLIFLFVGLEKNRQKKFFLGSFLLGLSLTSSIEYGLAAIISACFYFFLTLFKKPIKIVLKKVAVFLALVVSVSLPYFFFLWQTQALKNFIVFTLQYAQSFYHHSPCRQFFPRFNEVGFSLSFLQRINLYFVPLLLLVFLGWVIYQRKAWWSPFILSLLIYSLLIFYRILSTPCFGYLTYGLVFLFFILAFILSLPKKSPRLKAFIWLLVFWFLFVGFFTFFDKLSSGIKRIKNRTTAEVEFLPFAGIKLERELTKEYQAVTDFIKENSQNDDTIYVYPWGPYHQLAQRKSAVSIASTWYYDLAPFLIDKTYQQLNEKKPKLIVINIYNGWSIKSLLLQLFYNLHLEDENIFFEGVTTPVEDFISENYQLAKKFKIAWVLTRKTEPEVSQKLYLPAENINLWQITTQGLERESYLTFDDSVSFKVTGANSLIRFNLTEANSQFDLIKIPIKINLGLSKTFSKFIINLYLTTGDDKSYLLSRQIVSSDWQNIWAQLTQEEYKNINSMTVIISDNQGFFWWGKPGRIDLKTPEIFIRNQNLKIDDSAFLIIDDQYQLPNVIKSD